MRCRWLVRIAALLITVLAASWNDAKGWDSLRLDVMSISTRQQFRGTICNVMGWKQGSMASFTARQDLRDEVCIAMSDGQMSRAERFQILSDAQAVLSAEEFAGFKQALDRYTPAPPAVAKRSMKAQQAARLAQAKPMPTQQQFSQMSRPLAEKTLTPADVSVDAGEVFVSD